MTSAKENPTSPDFFILSLMRLDRNHYQRIVAVSELTGDEMDYYLFSRNGELENLILDYLGFPADGTAIKGGGTFNREAWDWEYHEMLEGGLPATDVLARMKREVAEARATTDS